MFPDLSWSGTDAAAQAGPGTYPDELADGGTFTGRSRHAALFYQGPGEYLPALNSVITASRARGDALFIAVPGNGSR